MRLMSCIFCLVVGLPLQAQRAEADSLLRIKPTGSDTSAIKHYYKLGKAFLRISKDSARLFTEKCLDLARSSGQKKYEGEAYSLLGVLEKNSGNYQEAIELHLKALRIKETLNDKYGMCICYNDLGVTHKQMRKFEKAIDFYQKSYALAEEIKLTKGAAMTLNNIGTIYLETNKDDSALMYFNRSLDRGRLHKMDDVIATAAGNLGEYYNKLKKPEQAIGYFLQCLEIDKREDNKYGLVMDYLSLAQSYEHKKNLPQAIVYYDSGIAICKAENLRGELLDAYRNLANSYAENGNYNKAWEYGQLATTLKDSLFNSESNKQVEELLTKYETEKKDKALQQQQFENTKKKYWIAGLAGLLALGSMLGYSWYRRYRLQQEKKLQVEILHQQDMATRAVIEAEEKERKRIAGDLHDGVGQIMSAAKLNLSGLEGKLQFANDESRQIFDKALSLVDESCREVRHVSHNMMPNALLRAGLSSAVKEFIDKIDNTVLKVHLHSEGLNERLDSNVETVLYRVIQECVNNVIKHSGANHLDISLIRDGDGISATIEDNGKGFDTSQKDKFEGIGLKNILTRIQYLQGTVDFDSAPGRGTLVAIHVPLKQPM